jgi:diguanylate cyclase (GGDEF)-like protein
MEARHEAPGGGSSWRRLLTDPPFAERISWRDPLRSDTLITQDRGLMARTFGSLFYAGALLGLVILVFGRAAGRVELGMAILAALGFAAGTICFLGYRRLPLWFFHASAPAGTLMISVSTICAADGAEGAYALAYVWVASLSALFFSARTTALNILFAVAGYTAALTYLDLPFAATFGAALLFVLGSASIVIAALRSRIEGLAANLSVQARTDALTGLPNRRAFDERFEVESHRAMRYGQPLAIAICDLDGFKQVNDQLGHEGGDEALKRASDAIRRSVRLVDGVARLGGEEFGVILPNAGSDVAHGVGERVRKGIRDEFADDLIPLTISCGLAVFGKDGEGGELLRAADDALYRAKSRRDCTVTYDDFEDSRLVASSVK